MTIPSVMDARLQALKPGDKVRVPYVNSLAPPPELTFLCWHPRWPGVAILETSGGRIVSSRAEAIEPPEPLKAKPGVLYQRVLYQRGTVYAFGTPDGRLRSFSGSPFDFTPDWQEVEEP